MTVEEVRARTRKSQEVISQILRKLRSDTGCMIVVSVEMYETKDADGSVADSVSMVSLEARI